MKITLHSAWQLVLIILLFVNTIPVSSQIVQWNTFGKTGLESTLMHSQKDINLEDCILSLGSGITPRSNDNRFGGSNWFTNTNSLIDAITNHKYIEFTVSAKSGYSFSLNSLEFNWERSATGPTNLALRSSKDNFTTDIAIINTTVTSNTLYLINFSSSIENNLSTTFRIYGYGATSASGVAGFDIGSNNPNIKLFGTVNNLINFDGTLSDEIWNSALIHENSNRPTATIGANHILKSIYCNGDLENLYFAIEANLEPEYSIMLFLDTSTGGATTSGFLKSNAAPALSNWNSNHIFPEGFTPNFTAIIQRDNLNTYVLSIFNISQNSSVNYTANLAANPHPSIPLRGFEFKIPKSVLNYSANQDLKILTTYTKQDGYQTNQMIPETEFSQIDYEFANIDFSNTYTQPILVKYRSRQSGDYNQAHTWNLGSPSPANCTIEISHDHTVVMNSPVNPLKHLIIQANSNLRISNNVGFNVNENGNLNMLGGTLQIIADPIIIFNGNNQVNINNFIPGQSTFIFEGAASINSNQPFYNIELNDDTILQQPTKILNSLRLKNEATIINNKPLYEVNSSLIYSENGTYVKGLEWSPTTSLETPYNTILENNVQLALPLLATTGNNEIKNNLIIGSNANFDLTITNPSNENKLIVGNDFICHGTLSLGNDFYLGGNFNLFAGSNFLHNNKRVWFSKEGTQIINSPNIIEFSSIGFSNTSGKTTVQIGNNTLITAALGGNAIWFNHSENVIDLYGKHLTIGTISVPNSIAGDGSFKGGIYNTTSKITLLGIGNFGKIKFLPNFRYLELLEINRQASMIAFELESQLTVKTLALQKGIVDCGSYTLTISETGSILNASNENFIIAKKSTGGALRKNFPEVSNHAVSYIFPIGTSASEYSPAEISFNNTNFNNNAFLTVAAENEKWEQNLAISNYLNRYWEIIANQITNPKYTFEGTYLDNDIIGDEQLFKSGRFYTLNQQWTIGNLVNHTNNTISFTSSSGAISSSNNNSNIFTAGDPLSKVKLNVKGNSITIVNGANIPIEINHTKYPTINVAENANKTFSLNNVGLGTLTISNIEIIGDHEFSIIQRPPNGTNMQSGSTPLDLIINFNPNNPGLYNALIRITTNDQDEPIFEFSIKAEAINYLPCSYEDVPIILASQNFDNIDNLQIPTHINPHQSWEAGTAFAIENDNGQTNKFTGLGSWQISNQVATGIFELQNQNLLQEIEVSIELASFSKTNFNGSDLTDYVKFSISLDNGQTYSEELIVRGFDDAKWPFNENLQIANIDFDGNNIIENNKIFTTVLGGYSNNTGFGKVVIKNLPTQLHLLLKIEAKCDLNEIWALDNLTIKGKNKKVKIWDGNSWKNSNNLTVTPPNELESVIFAHNYSTSNTFPEIRACECQINSEATVTINENHQLIIQDDLIINGALQLKNSASLVQINDYSINDGIIKVERTTKPIHRFDYVYWSSPIKETADFLLGRNPNNLETLGLSPDTYFNKYHYWSNSQEWININYGNIPMTAAKGYIVRAPQTSQYGVNPYNTFSFSPFTANFIGEPNNGLIEIDIVGERKFNLIGNPYPSALDPIKFLTINGSNTIDGAIYIWTHNSAPTLLNQSFVYNNADYITYNLTGVIGEHDHESITLLNNNYKIPSGQSFFIRGAANNAVAKFNNEMRVSGSNDHFYRNSMNDQINNIENAKLWLNLTSPSNAKAQILIGYIPEATNNLDWGYDAEIFSNNETQFYSIINQTKLSIQGREHPLTTEDYFKVGYTSSEAGQFSINIAKIIGSLEDIPIYVHDIELNRWHNLSESPYYFNATAGTHNSRFTIKYLTDPSLNSFDTTTNKNQIVTSIKNGELEIKSTTLNISKVSIYNILGQNLVQMSNINNHSININLTSIQNQVILLVITDKLGNSYKNKISTFN